MTDGKNRWLARHPRLTIVLINAVVLVACLIIAEIILRSYITYNLGYYTRIKATSRELTYPWGTVPINSDGFPDEEFEPGGKQRIGYLGDSVNFGVGAGYGNRISEFLEQAYPRYDHWNFGGMGEALSHNEIENNLALAKKYKLSKIVYIFNLNDIMPDMADAKNEVPTVRKVQIFVWRYLDWLRGRSYVYSYVRTGIKNYLVSRGIEAHGYRAVELFPSQHIDVITETAQRINTMNSVLRDSGIDFYLVIVPYEMQISDHAARTYSDLNIKWESGFREGSTQRLLMNSIDKGVKVFDAYHAFTDADAANAVPKGAMAGEYFVYNRGDKMDWNHPTTKGHRTIADYLIRQNIFE